jgi:putative FmdB family regulatory protein
MPRYEYACTNPECGHAFELVQSFSDPAASECPVCGHRVRKVYGAVGVVFKGSGFYRTDSRSGSEKKTGGSANGTSSASSTTSKTDGASATKSDRSDKGSAGSGTAPKAAAS